MRSEDFRAFLIALSVCVASASIPVFAAEESPWTQQCMNEFDGIKMRLANVEKSQHEILAQKNKILEEIDRLRIWVRHNGSFAEKKKK